MKDEAKPMLRRAAVLAVLLAAAGCTSEQVYRSAQAWQQNQCEKNIDGAERARCMQNAGPGYEAYKQQIRPSTSDF
jgi:hypothetical protein